MTIGIAFGAIASSMVTDTPYPVNAADFDGTNDYMLRGADLTGNADSSQFIFSCWFRMDGSDGVQKEIYNAGTLGNGISISRDSSNRISVDIYDSSGSKEVAFTSSSTSFTSSSTWHHLLISCDTNFSAGNKLKKMMIDGVSDIANITDSASAFNIDFTRTNHSIGATVAGGSRFNGCLAEVYFAIGSYLDVTTAPNLAKFRKANGKPENLGTDGSTPTGSQPIIYLKNAAASFNTNSGSGGNFSITGSLDTASSSPSD